MMKVVEGGVICWCPHRVKTGKAQCEQMFSAVQQRTSPRYVGMYVSCH